MINILSLIMYWDQTQRKGHNVMGITLKPKKSTRYGPFNQAYNYDEGLKTFSKFIMDLHKRTNIFLTNIKKYQ
jgi:hypothetical protein